MTLRNLLLLTLMLSVLSAGACGLGPNPARATSQASAPAPATATVPPVPTATEAPTNTAEPSPTLEPTEAVTAAATVDPLAPTATLAAVLTPGAAGANAAEFVADVTVPDGTNFTPGEAFVKTWRLKNVGTSTWGAGYLVTYAKGEQMGGPQTLALPSSVPPGETVDISLDLTAPDQLGSHTGFWLLRTDAGQPFGIGPEANQPVYVQINVGTAGSADPGPTAQAGSLQVTSATLSVDQTSLAGACPQSFVFSAALTSQGGGTMTYRVEAVSDTPGFAFNLPEPNESVFTGAGPRTFNASYTLEFNGSVSGQVWVHVLSPNELESNKVSFSLSCQPAGE